MNVGKLIIKTVLDNKDFSKDYQKLNTKLKNEELNLEIKKTDVENSKQDMLQIQAELDKTIKKQKELNKAIKETEQEYNKIYSEAQTQGFTDERVSTLEALQDKLSNLKSEQIKINNEVDKQNEKYNKSVDNLNKAEAKYDIQKNKVAELRQEFEKIGNQGLLSNINENINKIGKGITNTIKKITRWAVALFGIRTLYSGIRTAINQITNEDAQLKADLDYMKTAFFSIFEPIARKILEIIKQVMMYVAYIVKLFTGKNIFENANKSLKSANGQAKELKKTLAGFDEMNILNTNSSTGGGGGISPSFDFNDVDLFAKWNLSDFIEKGKEIASNVAKGINQFFANMNWSELGKGVSDALIGIIDIIITFIEEVDWYRIGQSIADFLLSIKWIDIGLKLFDLLIDGMIAAMDLVEGVTNKIIEKLEDPKFYEELKSSGEKILDKLIEGASKIGDKLETVWSKIISWFLKKLGIEDNDAEQVGEKIAEGIHEGMDIAIEHLPFIGTFYKIIKYAKMAFGIHSPSKEFEDIGSNLMLGLKDGIAGGINGVIDTINWIIKKINSVLSFKWNKIEIAGVKLLDAGSINIGKIPLIPRLAKGTILNNPGHGVPVAGGRAIAGEAGREAYLPLSDEQLLEELGSSIGRHIILNLTNINKINGRVLNRETKKIRSEDEFAYNA